MDWNRIEGNWKQAKGKIKEKWGDLTDDDLDKIAGRRDQLEGKIQERYGIAKDQVRKDVDTWVESSELVDDRISSCAYQNKPPRLFSAGSRSLTISIRYAWGRRSPAVPSVTKL